MKLWAAYIIPPCCVVLSTPFQYVIMLQLNQFVLLLRLVSSMLFTENKPLIAGSRNEYIAKVYIW